MGQTNLAVLTRFFFQGTTVLPEDQKSGRNNEVTVRRGSTVCEFEVDFKKSF